MYRIKLYLCNKNDYHFSTEEKIGLMEITIINKSLPY